MKKWKPPLLGKRRSQWLGNPTPHRNIKRHKQLPQEVQNTSHRRQASAA
jgi:hypothetical protein